jgi:surface antigen/LysM repeat protein
LAVRDRLLRHGVVVVAALALPMLVPHAVSHLPSLPALASAGDDASRSSATIERGASAPSIPQRPAQTIVVNQGDTIAALAGSFHADAAAMRWANGLGDGVEPRAGAALLVPPGPGALVRVNAGERPSSFAARIGLDPRVILDYNALPSDAPLTAGSYLQVPAAAAGGDAIAAQWVVPNADGLPAVPTEQYQHGGSSNGGFPYGQCTYYVSTKRKVDWNGDAWMWFRNARGAGRPEGRVPVAGAIVVMWGSWVGHVAYVEQVYPDGSFRISEMNVRGVGVRDERTVTVSSIDLIGFIY